MASVFDVAKYILINHGSMTTLKLQKLVYYSQAWSLVWDDKRLFDNRIEAWVNGPVCPDLYNVHKGMFQIVAEDLSLGHDNNLTENEKETIDVVIGAYGKLSGSDLADLTHTEKPWLTARENLPASASSSNEITDDMMYGFYSSIK